MDISSRTGAKINDMRLIFAILKMEQHSIPNTAIFCISIKITLCDLKSYKNNFN